MMRRGRWVVTVMAVAALYCACGIKSRPLPPESVRPKTIADLHAESTADGISLGWSRPMRLVDGSPLRNLGEFQIYRQTGNQPEQLITEVPVTDLQRFRQEHRFSYLDKSTQPGTRYQYWVIAVSLDGYSSHPSNVAVIVRTVPPPPPNPENFVFPTPVMPR